MPEFAHTPIFLSHGSSPTYSQTQPLKLNKLKGVCLANHKTIVCHLCFFIHQTDTPQILPMIPLATPLEAFHKM